MPQGLDRLIQMLPVNDCLVKARTQHMWLKALTDPNMSLQMMWKPFG
jgi:hypothetical protein